MKRFLIACAVIAGLAAAGMFLNFNFAPLASYAQPTQTPP
jgi:hypothetical protein